MVFTETLENFPILAARQSSLLSLEGATQFQNINTSEAGREKGIKEPLKCMLETEAAQRHRHGPQRL
jgi:hypothetical protein